MSATKCQYPTRKAALRALRRRFLISNLRFDRLDGEMISPAEVWILHRLVCWTRTKELLKTRDKNLLHKTSSWRKSSERELRAARSICRSLGLFPIPDWVPRYLKTMERMGKIPVSGSDSEVI